MFNTSNNYLITIMDYTAREEISNNDLLQINEFSVNIDVLPRFVDPWDFDIFVTNTVVDNEIVRITTCPLSELFDSSPIKNSTLGEVYSVARAVEQKILHFLNFLLNSEEILKENPSFSMNDCYTDVFEEKYSILKPSDKDCGIVLPELTASLKAEDFNIMAEFVRDVIAPIEKKCFDLQKTIDSYVEDVSENRLTPDDVVLAWTVERKRTLKFFKTISIPKNLDSSLTSLLLRFKNNILQNLISSKQCRAFKRLF